jgi:hypothetical protein
MPQRHKDTKDHKGHLFFIPKIKPFCVSLSLCALVAKKLMWESLFHLENG